MMELNRSIWQSHLPDMEQWMSTEGVHLPGAAPSAHETTTVYTCSLNSHAVSYHGENTLDLKSLLMIGREINTPDTRQQ